MSSVHLVWEFLQRKFFIRRHFRIVKFIYGEFSYGKISIRRNFLRRNFSTAKIPYGEISLRLNILMAKFPYGESFQRPNFPRRKFLQRKIRSRARPTKLFSYTARPGRVNQGWFRRSIDTIPRKKFIHKIDNKQMLFWWMCDTWFGCQTRRRPTKNAPYHPNLELEEFL